MLAVAALLGHAAHAQEPTRADADAMQTKAEVAGIVGAANAVNIRCGVTLDADLSVAIHRRL